MINLEIKRPKRVTRRLNILTDEGKILVSIFFSFGVLIGTALYFAVISSFLR